MGVLYVILIFICLRLPCSYDEDDDVDGMMVVFADVGCFPIMLTVPSDSSRETLHLHQQFEPVL